VEWVQVFEFMNEIDSCWCLWVVVSFEGTFFSPPTKPDTFFLQREREKERKGVHKKLLIKLELLAVGLLFLRDRVSPAAIELRGWSIKAKTPC
jgi:hypothetical protein